MIKVLDFTFEDNPMDDVGLGVSGLLEDMHVPFGSVLDLLRYCIQDIARFVKPTALFFGGTKDLANRIFGNSRLHHRRLDQGHRGTHPSRGQCLETALGRS